MATPNSQSTKTVTIGAAASLSGSSGLFDGAQRLIGFAVDAAWDTQAVSFQGSLDGVTFFNLYDEATEYSQAGVVASTLHTVKLMVFLPLRAVKIRSGTAGTPANQTDATVVTLVMTAI